MPTTSNPLNLKEEFLTARDLIMLLRVVFFRRD